ncbi:MAG: PilZ domain-containing protein [Terriglobales bacterium]
MATIYDSIRQNVWIDPPFGRTLLTSRSTTSSGILHFGTLLTTFGGETGMWEKERKARRVPAVEPVSGSFTNGGIHDVSGVTRDVSPAGAFFYCEIAPEVGSEIALVFSLPAELVKDSAQVLCRGRVVRVESAGGSSKVGVAVEFETIERLPSS